MTYNHQEVESKWAKKWKDSNLFVCNFDDSDQKFYSLFMFPYPSAEGLHIGNYFCFTVSDLIAKFKRLQGYNAFCPIGWDAFGMHSENYAIKIGETPQKMLSRTVENFRNQMIESGFGVDFTKEVDTTSKEYYKWTQWIFLKLLEKDLAFQKSSLLNYCPSCKTVLADEQIENGGCERCKTQPEKKEMKQWFFKITEFGDRLLDGLSDMDWSDITKSAQKNWIGKSKGAEITVKVDGLDKELTYFTTRPDTTFGASFITVAPELKDVLDLVLPEFVMQAQEYIAVSGAKSDLDRISDNKEKTGIFTGRYAIQPVTGHKLPIYISDYVLANVGTGVVVGVPAHDKRDFEFAEAFNLPIKRVISKDGSDSKISSVDDVYTQDGILLNSDFLNGLKVSDAITKIGEYIEEKGFGKRVTNYRLRDWCISRQRYWGPPIPVVHCDDCGVVPVPESQLPVELPEKLENWEPSGDGKGPLANVDEFINVPCPKCGKPAKRDADVTDNFLDSSWYMLRYLDPHNDSEIFNVERIKKWMPVDFYVGGNEHAVMHLMYVRFICMALFDLDLLPTENPFKKFRANGMLLKDGVKMSKSKGNVINPEEYGRKVSFDALRTYILFLGPLSEDRSFSEDGILGTRRWIDKIYKLLEKVEDKYLDSDDLLYLYNKTNKEVVIDLDEHKFNTVVAKLMELTNALIKQEKISKEVFEGFLVMVAPFLQFLAEECYSQLGNTDSVFNASWPKLDESKLVKSSIVVVVQIAGKVRAKLQVSPNITQEEIQKLALENSDVQKWLDGKEPKKVIYVPGKLVSVVV
ncbi:leucine--tRNA ligase [bacterium]|jgi:leucyl-tRNA synthetase|nr:leucine--tRNA ligase [bacterium]MBT6294044.1 leucine--tRNA ligase [bacterium]